MKRVKRPELRLHGQKVRLKKKPVILAVSVLVLIVLLVSVSVHAASKKHTQKVSAGVAEETAAAVEETTVAEEKLSEEEKTTAKLPSERGAETMSEFNDNGGSTADRR